MQQNQKDMVIILPGVKPQEQKTGKLDMHGIPINGVTELVICLQNTVVLTICAC